MMHNHSKLKYSIPNNNTIYDRKVEIINLQVSSDKAYEIAKQHCIETLLNCFYRETRASGKYIRVLSSKELKNIDTKLPKSLMNHRGFFMLINLTAIDAEIIVAIKNDSKIGFCYYQSMPYLKLNNTTWKTLTWDELAILLLKELANCYQQPFNNELFEQIKNSVQVMSNSIKFNKQLNRKEKNKELNFIESEQSLLFGHAFHPSPKSREGLTLQEIDEFSPEFKAKFSLHYFLVRKDYIIQHSLLEKSAIELVQENSPKYLQEKDNYVLICTHPWQANYLKQLSIVKKALKQGYLYDLGQKGDQYYPTSSIRTVYHPNNSFFYKFSLNIRITNCVRKNAIYELKTAVCLTKILLTKLDEIKHNFPNFHLMLEPAYLSIDLPKGSADEKKEVTEGFGMIFRQNFSPLQLEESTPILAGSLFGKSLGNSNIFNNINELCNKLNVSYEMAATIWFNQYAGKIIHPLLYCHFNLGITFEPHLQNVLIGMKDHMPLCVFVRDLEGTKLSTEHWSAEDFTDLEESARQSVYYSEQLAWNRITYCLLVNNIGEAIFHIANGCARLEMMLWGIVRQHLISFQDKYGNEHSKNRIHGLLTNDPLPIKCNFMTRFLKRADKGAVYDYLLDHPLQENNSHREINVCAAL